MVDNNELMSGDNWFDYINSTHALQIYFFPTELLTFAVAVRDWSLITGRGGGLQNGRGGGT